MSFFEVLQVYMQDILRQMSEWSLWPVMFLLIIGAVYAVWCIVSVLIEYFMQRRHFNENVPVFVDKIEACSISEVEPLIEGSGMLVSQKDAMLEVAKRMMMAPADLYAVANREIGLCKEEYTRVLGRTDVVSKIAPMVGLMGTLIPLGPGIVAMGQGNVEELSASILIAFDTTVAGLIIAGITIVVSKVRKGWYTKYHAALEACMTALLQKAQTYRESLEDNPELGDVQIVDESKRKGPYLRKEIDIPFGPHADSIDNSFINSSDITQVIPVAEVPEQQPRRTMVVERNLRTVEKQAVQESIAEGFQPVEPETFAKNVRRPFIYETAAMETVIQRPSNLDVVEQKPEEPTPTAQSIKERVPEVRSETLPDVVATTQTPYSEPAVSSEPVQSEVVEPKPEPIPEPGPKPVEPEPIPEPVKVEPEPEPIQEPVVSEKRSETTTQVSDGFIPLDVLLGTTKTSIHIEGERK